MYPDNIILQADYSGHCGEEQVKAMTAAMVEGDIRYMALYYLKTNKYLQLFNG